MFVFIVVVLVLVFLSDCTWFAVVWLLAFWRLVFGIWWGLLFWLVCVWDRFVVLVGLLRELVGLVLMDVSVLLLFLL